MVSDSVSAKGEVSETTLVERRFTKAGEDPFDSCAWKIVTTSITDQTGKQVFHQEGVEVPVHFSQLAADITASKYFRRAGLGSDGKSGEHSFKQLVGRVVEAISQAGTRQGYFQGDEAQVFRDELTYMLVHQYGAFNSPVWFNCGIWEKYGVAGNGGAWAWNAGTCGAEQILNAYEHPQSSACMPYDVRVNTTVGLIPIGEIVERFKLNPEVDIATFDRKGKPTKILHAINNGKRGVSEFELRDGSAIRMTLDHRLFVRDIEGHISEKSAGDIVLGEDHLVLSRAPLLGTQIPQVGGFLPVTADMAWISGVMVGNGFSGRPPSASSDIWELKVNTPAEVARIEALMAMHGVPYTRTEFHWGAVVRGYGAPGRVFWERLGLWNKTGAKEAPAWVMQSGVEIVSAFLQGLFDTDGTVNQQPNGRVTIGLSNTSEQVINTAHILLRSLGIFAAKSSYQDPRDGASRKEGFSIIIQDICSADLFADLVGFTHEGKKLELEERCPDRDRAYRTDSVLVVSRHTVGAAPVYDIQTESGVFWAEGILVHNCFINAVEDDLESIYRLARNEAMLFKFGSGTGSSMSPLRSKYERISGGGYSSGLLSFLHLLDGVAGSTKSGGISRRAAVMRVLDTSHPEIEEFIAWKMKEEKKARALVAAGYTGGQDGEAYRTVSGQNSNNSIAASDEFMRAVEEDGEWKTTARTTGEVIHTHKARDLWNKIAEAAWFCADPGLQYSTTINKFNTVKASGRINSSNPCQPGFATILTPEGIGTFDDIDVGSTIWSGKRWTKVTRKVATGVKDVNCYDTNDGCFIGTKDHTVISNGVRVKAEFAKTIDKAEYPPEFGDPEDYAYVTSDSTVTNVEFLGQFPVWDIEVEAEEHTYWTGGLLVSNCSEFFFIDDSACNLASLNLTKFVKNGTFDVDAFEHAVRVFFTAQDILVDYASYPTKEIAENSHRFRPLGIGYANLGTLVMTQGFGYDSPEGRALAGAVTALMTGFAGKTSAMLAERLGAYDAYELNAESHKQVIQLHNEAVQALLPVKTQKHLVAKAWEVWNGILEPEKGFRNAQFSLLAPCGTIGFLMDTDTTGIEPDYALVKYKKLSGGGNLKIVNRSVEEALGKLGYTEEQIAEARAFITDNDTIEGWPGLKKKHLAVFDCAQKSGSGKRFIPASGHLAMMAAVQPFLSGAISKCVTGDTIVPSEYGLLRIGGLYQQGQQEGQFIDIDLVVASRAGEERANQFYFGGVKAVASVTLSDGRVLRGTPVHRLLAACGDALDWKALGELSPGDWVALSPGADLWGTDKAISFMPSPSYGNQLKSITFPSSMSPELGMFLGMLTSDGHLTAASYAVGITKNSKEVRERFRFLTKKLFNADAREIRDARNGVMSAAFNSKAVHEFISSLGFSKSNIPDVVLTSSKDTVLAYLSGLYLDGYLTQSVSISQKSASLISDVQQVWHNMGIYAYVNRNEVGGENYPVLHVSAHCSKAAAQALEWLEPHKKALAAVMEDGEDRRVLPFPELRQQIATEVRQQNQYQFRGVLDKRTPNIRTSTLLDAAQHLGVSVDPELGRYTYVQVESVEMGEAEPVYDLSVPGSNSYSANGIVSHNTVNLPSTATVADVADVYMQGWKLGLKAVALYRDGCKGGQVLNTKKDDEESKKEVKVSKHPKSLRQRLPKKRKGLTQEATIGGHKLYLRTGEYEDGTLGEIFIDMHKEGAAFRAIMNCFARAVSVALQHGVPLETFVKQFTFIRFDPSGPVDGHENIKIATSVLDYVFRSLGIEYLGRDDLAHVKPTHSVTTGPGETAALELVPEKDPSADEVNDAPLCGDCGSLTVRNGTCYRCTNCGSSMGCS